jgi:multidrug resistance efflux pump
MFEALRRAVRELREIRQNMRDEQSGVAQARREREFAEQEAQRETERRAFRRKLERAVRRKPDITLAELHKRFPVKGTASLSRSTYRRARPISSSR